MTYDMMTGMGWGGMAFGGLMMLLWIALLVGLIVGVIVLIARLLRGTSGRTAKRDALDTLRQRFARGEIDTTEFEERSQYLRASK